ncbi:MAG: hypothetical protein QHC90_15005 [Shinella sp.]|nr:hypothetical protein [Shinella sp.]
MLSIMAVLAQHLFSGVEDRVEAAASYMRRNVLVLSIAGLFLATAYVLAIIAGSVALSERYGTVPALSWLAGAFLIAALVAIGILSFLNRRERRLRRIRLRQTQTRRDLMALATAAVTRKPLVSTGLALALGLLLSPSSKSRRRRKDDD